MGEIEAELLKLKEQLEEVEGLLSNPELYRDSNKAIWATGEHGRLGETIRLLTEEWDRLAVEAETIKWEFEETRNNIEA